MCVFSFDYRIICASEHWRLNWFPTKQPRRKLGWFVFLHTNHGIRSEAVRDWSNYRVFPFLDMHNVWGEFYVVVVSTVTGGDVVVETQLGRITVEPLAKTTTCCLYPKTMLPMFHYLQRLRISCSFRIIVCMPVTFNSSSRNHVVNTLLSNPC